MTKQEFLNELIKRLKSLAWRGLVGFLVGFIAWLVGLIPQLNLPEVLTAVIILVLNEVTKWLNNHTTMFGSKLK